MPRPPRDQNEREERALVMMGMTRRINERGFHPHCVGCPKLVRCGVPNDPGSIVECDERPGPLFAEFYERENRHNRRTP